MYIHIGSHPYGTCDVVPELFYVATWFGHFDYIPLIPLQTNLVLGKTGNQYHVVKLPLSVKSILLAWSRVGTFAGIVTLGILGLIEYGDHHNAQDATLYWGSAALLGLLYAFLMIYPRKKMPSYERACQLAQFANLNDTGWAALNVLYGRDPFDRPTPAPRA